MNRIQEETQKNEIIYRILRRIRSMKFKRRFARICCKCPIGTNKDTKQKNAFFCKNCKSLAVNHYKQTGEIRFPFTLKFRR
ncbi:MULTISPECIES: hypothetical protein [Methanobacterium]|uniref:Uncharacterized protein n=1 Tax=Methanobacterium veterum TaxID=408577 RepID=A0A9E5DKF4_9EURY|nr:MULTISPECIES: hypothetical protein [Methanobacterium]MCZ3367257.1 hypothetical protein [Methanobacterium veterum]MCZ3373595.1 hypothetical protein [Methanobacterium veterum]